MTLQCPDDANRNVKICKTGVGRVGTPFPNPATLHAARVDGWQPRPSASCEGASAVPSAASSATHVSAPSTPEDQTPGHMEEKVVEVVESLGRMFDGYLALKGGPAHRDAHTRLVLELARLCPAFAEYHNGRKSEWMRMREEIRDEARETIRREERDEVRRKVLDEVRREVRDEVRDKVIAAVMGALPC